MARQDSRGPSPGIVPHTAYRTWAPTWEQLLDVYEGAGGFADPLRPYLHAHPREWLDHSTKVVSDDNPTGKWVANDSPSRPSPKLKARRKIARYEPIASTLVDQLRSALFRKAAHRDFQTQDVPDDHPLRQFWENADGTGRAIDVVMADYWTAAAVFGHMFLYADRDGSTPDTPTQADQPPVIMRGYTPLDVPDWLTDDMGRLTAVRLLEAQVRDTFDIASDGLLAQVRDVDATTWTVRQVTQKKKLGEVQDTGAHGFGVLPIVPLYAKRRALTPVIGRSVLGDPALYIDLYNLTSEVRELLRNQTFAILNVPLGAEGSVEREMGLIGETAGTTNVLFSSQAADYVSPEGTNVHVYHEHIDRLARTIYRLAVVSWESDSKDAEAADSRRIKKADLHEMLAGYAAECEAAERQMAELVYRAHYGDRWQQQWDADQPSISYPDDFDVSGLLDEIEAVTQGIALELGETATKQLKKRVIPRLLPNLPQAVAQAIDDEIQEMEVKTADEKERELMEMRFGPSAQGDGDPANPDEVPA